MKPVPADEAPDATVLRAAPEPEIVLIVSDTGGASLVDSKAAASETNIPDLGDHATLVFGPVSNDANARRAFRVWVSAASRSYALFYSPNVMDQESREVAEQLAREVLRGDFKGWCQRQSMR